jgi:hypothetical protein
VFVTTPTSVANSHVGAIVGGIVGAVVILVMMAGIGFFVVRCRRTSTESAMSTVMNGSEVADTMQSPPAQDAVYGRVSELVHAYDTGDVAATTPEVRQSEYESGNIASTVATASEYNAGSLVEANDTYDVGDIDTAKFADTVVEKNAK